MGPLKLAIFQSNVTYTLAYFRRSFILTRFKHVHGCINGQCVLLYHAYLFYLPLLTLNSNLIRITVIQCVTKIMSNCSLVASLIATKLFIEPHFIQRSNFIQCLQNILVLYVHCSLSFVSLYFCFHSGVKLLFFCLFLFHLAVSLSCHRPY